MARDYNEYNDLGVRFVYPKNWFVRTETWDKGTYSITVDCPEGSFWSISIFPKGVNLDKAAKDIVETMHAEYEEMEEREVKHYVADYVLSGYEIDFFYLDLTSAATALKFEDERRGYVIYWQTCDHLTTEGDDELRSDIFDAMTHTLVSNLTGQEDDWGEEEDEAHFERKLSDREAVAQKADENREYLRRKYGRLQAKEQERRWRQGGEEDLFPDYHGFQIYQPSSVANDERIEDFLRASADSADQEDEFEEDEKDQERHYYDDDPDEAKNVDKDDYEYDDDLDADDLDDD
ncbi:MAG: hypothetical protein IJM54_06500 [Thermoguttaceae bacterium]|nr:hypothetical protein [Thermoguttaceae bacterium]